MTNPLEPTPSFSLGEPTGRAGWWWRLEDGSGTEVAAPEDGVASGASGFPSQSDAESWVGEVWRELVEEGVAQVSLFEADRLVYGPMGLQAAG